MLRSPDAQQKDTWKCHSVFVPSTSARKTFVRQRQPVHVQRRSLLRFTDFRSLVIGQYISQFADAATSVLIAQYVLFESNNGPTATLLIQSVLTAAVPLFLAGPISGAIADKFARRTILHYGQWLRVLLTAALFVCSQVGERHAVLVIFAVCLCITKVLYTTRVATIRHLVRQHELVAADSLLLTLSNVAGATGGALGVVALRYMHHSGLLLVMVCHALSAWVFARINTPLGGGRDHVPTSWSSAARNLWSAKTRYAIATTSVHRLLFGVAFSSAALFLDNGTSGSYALLLGASGLGSFIGNATAEWVNEHFPRRSVAVVAYLGSSVVAWTCLVNSNSHIVVPSIVVLAFLFQNLRVCSDATVQKNAAKGAGGRVFAAYDLLSNASFLLGLLVGLTFMPAFGIGVVFASLIGAFGFGSTVFGLMSRGDGDGSGVQPTIDVVPAVQNTITRSTYSQILR